MITPPQGGQLVEYIKGLEREMEYHHDVVITCREALLSTRNVEACAVANVLFRLANDQCGIIDALSDSRVKLAGAEV